MLVFSQNLNQSLSRAIAQAEQQSYGCATPEHVLLALIDDPDAIPVMQACNVDLEKLRAAVEASMPHSDYVMEGDESKDAPDSDESDEAPNEDGRIPVEHFQVALQRAIAHARSSECEEVNSADVLVALLDRPIGEILKEHSLTRYDATTFICHGISRDAQTPSRRDDVANCSGLHASSGEAAGSATFKVRLLNDSYTPTEFVVYALKEVLELDDEDAERIMLEIHHEGAGACGAYTREEARAARIMDLARQHQHPLRCCVQA